VENCLQIRHHHSSQLNEDSTSQENASLDLHPVTGDNVLLLCMSHMGGLYDRIDGAGDLYDMFKDHVKGFPTVFKIPDAQLTQGEIMHTEESICKALKEVKLASHNTENARKDLEDWIDEEMLLEVNT
tara:strand:+ start:133 stop:516 length:384 start_codon:yes stop_codon:yes gene_type:complete